MTIDEQVEQAVQEVKKEKKFYYPRNMASTIMYPLMDRAIRDTLYKREYTNEQIEGWVKSPYISYQYLQEVSQYFWSISPFYQNILYYLSTGCSFDYTLNPLELTDNASAMWKRLENAARVVWKAQIKETFPTMLLRTLINGETYWYDLSDDENTIIKEIPSKICRYAMIDDDNLWRYYVDFDMVDNATVKVAELPMEIRQGYYAYLESKKSKDNKKKGKRVVEGIQLPDNLMLVSKRGFAMSAHPFFNNPHDYPYLSSLFTDLNTYENDKDYFNEFVKNDNIKLVHNKIPIDKESGLPLMDYDDILNYHQSTKEHLPKNVAPLTNPFETTAINLDKAQQANINIVEQSKINAQFGSGISETLFNANTNTGLRFSILFDMTKMFTFFSFFENFINYKIKKYKFAISFLPITHYNRLEWYETYRSSMAQGGSRWNFISLESTDLYSWIMSAKLADIISIDDLMPTKESAYQQSSGDSGRPASKEPEEATLVGKEYE